MYTSNERLFIINKYQKTHLIYYFTYTQIYIYNNNNNNIY